MNRLLAVLFLVIIVIAVYGSFNRQTYVVQADWANGKVVRILDANTGKAVKKTFEQLKIEGAPYEVMYVQPRTMY